MSNKSNTNLDYISNWKFHAICASDPNGKAWMSYKKEDIDYAKAGCQKCSVRVPCFLAAWESEYFHGVNGGISEFEFMIKTWKKARKEQDDNWRRTDRDFQKILREIQ